MQLSTTNLNQQRGGALITALSILLILTILGVSAMSTTALQERMAGNARDHEVAFEAAEYSLRAAEAFVQTLNSTSMTTNFSTSGGTGGYYTPRALPTDTEAWLSWATFANPATFGMSVSQQPQYIIQVVKSELGLSTDPKANPGYGGPPVLQPTVFQITARGFGLSSTSRVMLQSYFVRYL